uniref:Uncharacterized protein n=1 Tax=Oryza nivara TaxID=4536 RepID=A0A0E0GJB6_ORYNI
MEALAIVPWWQLPFHSQHVFNISRPLGPLAKSRHLNHRIILLTEHLPLTRIFFHLLPSIRAPSLPPPIR